MEELYQKLEAYLNEEMGAAEKEEMDRQLSQDPSLREELDQLRKVWEVVKKNTVLEKEKAEFLAMLKEGNQEEGRVVKMRPANWLWLAVAAAVAIVLLSIFYFNPKEESPRDLYATYAIPPTLPNLRETQTSACQEGALAFREKDFASAIPLLEACLNDSSKGIEYELALAYAYMESGQNQAVDLLQKLISQKGKYMPSVRYKAAWYLVLVKVKEENWSQAMAGLQLLLEQEDLPDPQREEAEALLDDMLKLGLPVVEP